MSSLGFRLNKSFQLIVLFGTPNGWTSARFTAGPACLYLRHGWWVRHWRSVDAKMLTHQNCDRRLRLGILSDIRFLSTDAR